MQRDAKLLLGKPIEQLILGMYYHSNIISSQTYFG